MCLKEHSITSNTGQKIHSIWVYIPVTHQYTWKLTTVFRIKKNITEQLHSNCVNLIFNLESVIIELCDWCTKLIHWMSKLSVYDNNNYKRYKIFLQRKEHSSLKRLWFWINNKIKCDFYYNTITIILFLNQNN